jgi:hypothetical protein
MRRRQSVLGMLYLACTCIWLYLACIWHGLSYCVLTATRAPRHCRYAHCCGNMLQLVARHDQEVLTGLQVSRVVEHVTLMVIPSSIVVSQSSSLSICSCENEIVGCDTSCSFQEQHLEVHWLATRDGLAPNCHTQHSSTVAPTCSHYGVSLLSGRDPVCIATVES